MKKWTEAKKIVALEAMKNGESNCAIASKVDMSESSVILLRYSKFKVNEERVQCTICGEKFKHIKENHLKKHSITLEEYKIKYPDISRITDSRKKDYKSFKSKNKGKTFEEIYGEDEGKRKKELISNKQIGRKCPQNAGTGITGTRRDTCTFARSTYEANIDRIFQYENKKYISELDDRNERFSLLDDDKEISYQPDRIDVDGLFCKGSYLEIKGYMFPEDWKKICLFRDQYLDKKLIVIGFDKNYSDLDYNELKHLYQDKIPLWETSKTNYKTRPDLYKVGYIEPERVNFLKTNFPNHIHKSICDPHKLFIAEKCLSYNKVKLGKSVNIEHINLLAITNRRYGANRKSSGVYNYEIWEVITEESEVFFVTNQSKTIDFYTYQQDKKDQLMKFFKNNCEMSLQYGKRSVEKFLTF